jgi:hypothetical protein
MAKAKDIDSIKISLDKEKDVLSKVTKRLSILKEQRKLLKNKAKVVSLLEYKNIIFEILNDSKLLVDVTKKVDELLVKYEKNQRNQKS